VDRVVLHVKDQLLTPSGGAPAERGPLLEVPLSRPMNPMDGESHAPAAEEEKSSAVWLTVVFTAGLGGDVIRWRSLPTEK
jgi:hypothetical protein